jgi:hypothetical protein
MSFDERNIYIHMGSQTLLYLDLTKIAVNSNVILKKDISSTYNLGWFTFSKLEFCCSDE